jgi:hypothetical protein
MRKVKCTADLERLVLTPTVDLCEQCGTMLYVTQHRTRPLQTLNESRLVVARDKSCPNADCSAYHKPIRPFSEGLLPVLPRCEYGLDVVVFVGEGRLTGGKSQPQIHQELEEQHGVRISGRHVGNLFKIFLALVHAVNAETDVIRRFLVAQGGIILSIDGVAFDDTSPVLYVLRDVLSGEILYSERVDRRDDTKLGELLEKIKALGVPVLGVISDKEKAIVSAVARVFPDVPHQYCHLHFLKNLAKPMDSDLAALGTAVKEVLTDIKRLDRDLQTQAETHRSSPAELAMAQSLVKAARAAGSVSGDAVLDPAPLKRLQRLQRVAETAEAASKKKGGQWPLLALVVSTLSALSGHAELARRLALQVGMLRRIAHILDSESSGTQVQRILRTYLNRQLKSAPQRGRGAPRGDFIREVGKIADRFWPGLFHTFDIAGLPRTNNDTERLFGAVKRQERKSTGRKSTAGGPLETCAEFVLESWSSLMQRPAVKERLRDVSPQALQQARKDLEQLAEPARNRRSIQREPEDHLESAMQEWKEA